MEAKEWLNVEDVANLLDVHQQSIRRWIRAGELPASQLGDKAGYRISRKDLEAFMEARKLSTPTGGSDRTRLVGH